jgi:hypothetical protein
MLKTGAVPSSIAPGGTSNVTADMTFNSDNWFRWAPSEHSRHLECHQRHDDAADRHRRGRSRQLDLYFD